jgi:hypothetical protein
MVRLETEIIIMKTNIFITLVEIENIKIPNKLFWTRKA